MNPAIFIISAVCILAGSYAVAKFLAERYRLGPPPQTIARWERIVGYGFAATFFTVCFLLFLFAMLRNDWFDDPHVGYILIVPAGLGVIAVCIWIALGRLLKNHQ